MSWFFVALISPIASALVNHVDKYLISRFLKGGSVGTLILFSSLFAVFALPVIYLIHPIDFSAINAQDVGILMGSGVLLVVAIITYLHALDLDEASNVIPLFQLVPVFSFFLAYFILGEKLSSAHILAGSLIVIGSFILSLKFSSGGARLKKKLVLLMLASSLFYALSAIVFKFVAIDENFYNSLFWLMAGKVIFGILLFLSIKSYQSQFISLLKSNSLPIIGLNSFNEILALVAEVSIVVAVLMAPVALVESVSGLQPLFVLIIGILLTLLFPNIISKESLKPRDLAHKIIAILIITVGVYLLPR